MSSDKQENSPAVDVEKAATVEQDPDADTSSRPYERWLVLFVASLGGLLASIQSSALVIAFPTLISALGADVVTIMWVLLSFLLVCAAITILTGRLGDMFGQANLFKLGYVLFTISTLLSGFSQPSAKGLDLIAYRVIMGLGATFLFTNSAALVVDAFAPFNQVGISQGIFQLTFAAGSVLGPVVGGGLAVTDWRWIFWLNVPCAGLATIMAFIVVKQKPLPRRPFLTNLRNFDWLGMILTIGFVLLIMLALTQSAVPDPNLSSNAGLACLVVIGTACLVAFCLNEQYWAIEPLIHLKIFVNRTFTISLITGTIVSFARGLVTYGMIFFLQGVLGEDPLTAGLQLIPFGLGIIITGFAAGLLTDKIGVRNLSVLGPIVAAAGSIGLVFCFKSTNYWLIAFALFVIGMGSGIFNSPNGASGMMSVKANERGVAAALRLLTSFLASMIGIVITFALVLNSLTYQELFVLFIYGGANLADDAVVSITDAIHIIFWIVFASFALSALLSFFIPASFSIRRPGSTTSLLPKSADAAKSTELGEVKSVEMEQRKPEETDKSKPAAATAAADNNATEPVPSVDALEDVKSSEPLHA